MFKNNIKKFLENNEFYEIEIDNKKYKFKTIDIIKLITSDDFDKKVENTKINGIKKEYFLYSSLKFFSDNNLLGKYLFNNKAKENILKINDNNFNLYPINKLNETDYEIIDKIDINEDLKKYILKDIPKNYYDLQKTIYIYIKLWKTLTYDQEYFATNQEGLPLVRHSNIDNIKNIDLINNEVVYYDFIGIFARFLKDININFTVVARNENFKVFGDGHVYLVFKCNDYIVKVDPTYSILEGDLTNAKINKYLNGLECLNKNIKVQKKFQKIVNNVYKKIDKVLDYNSLVNKYLKNIKKMNYHEKINIFFLETY